MSRTCLLMNLLTCLLISLFSTAWASQPLVIADFSSEIDKNGVPSGWQLKERSGKADLSVIKDGDIHALRMRSANNSFALQKRVNVSTQQYPVLSWKWKVIELPEGGDFRRSKTDDQAAQLFLAFSKTKAIVYLWDTSAPQGLMEKAPSPPFFSIRAVVVRSGTAETGKWITETRNAFEDYKKLYGREPSTVGGVRIQINSQHTDSSAESFFAEVAFKKQ